MTHPERVSRYRKIVSLKKKGASAPEIAEMFGMSNQRIYQILSAGLPQPRKKRDGILNKHGFGHLEGRERARMMVRIRDNFTCQD